MSFYRTFIAAVAAFGLATSVFAADETTTSTTTDKTATQATAPATQTATTATDENASTNAMTDKVNINTASAKELMKVKGLNSAKAKAIVSYRKKHGDFKSTDDLKEVKGFKKMNEKTLKDIQDQVTV